MMGTPHRRKHSMLWAPMPDDYGSGGGGSLSLPLIAEVDPALEQAAWQPGMPAMTPGAPDPAAAQITEAAAAAAGVDAAGRSPLGFDLTCNAIDDRALRCIAEQSE
jgi:hypothetical protein